MRRRAPARDAGLVVRMVVVLALLVVSLLAVAGAIGGLFVLLPSWWPLWLAVAAGLAIGVVRQCRGVGERLLESADATIVDERSERELCRLTERVAAMFDLPAPSVAVSASEIPNVFAVGTRHDRSIVIVTEEMRRTLDVDELEAVVAHELSHIANRDAAVMTIASVPRVVGLELFAADIGINLWFFLWPLGLVLYLWSTFLTLALSRYRERIADTGAALATGRPETLMSALEKLSGEIGRIPATDLRALEGLNPLLILPVARRERRVELLMDHPPLEKRLAHLATIAREMGKAAR